MLQNFSSGYSVVTYICDMLGELPNDAVVILDVPQ